MTTYVVQLRADRNGHPRRRYFKSLEDACKFRADYFARYGVVLGVEEVR